MNALAEGVPPSLCRLASNKLADIRAALHTAEPGATLQLYEYKRIFRTPAPGGPALLQPNSGRRLSYPVCAPAQTKTEPQPPGFLGLYRGSLMGHHGDHGAPCSFMGPMWWPWGHMGPN